jgi:putative membrane protein
VDWVIKVVINAAALWVAELIVPGIVFGGEWWQLLVVAFIFAIVNTFVKPILQLLTLPITIVTLGLFLLIINALMLFLTSWVSTQLDLGFSVQGFLDAIFGAVIISIVSLILESVIGAGRRAV